MIPNNINDVDDGNIDDNKILRAPRRVNARPQLNRVKREESHIMRLENEVQMTVAKW